MTMKYLHSTTHIRERSGIIVYYIYRYPHNTFMTSNAGLVTRIPEVLNIPTRKQGDRVAVHVGFWFHILNQNCRFELQLTCNNTCYKQVLIVVAHTHSPMMSYTYIYLLLTVVLSLKSTVRLVLHIESVYNCRHYRQWRIFKFFLEGGSNKYFLYSE